MTRILPLTLGLCVLAAAALPAQREETGLRVESDALARGRHVVVIDLDANRLYFTLGARVLWSAPVGTGTGLRMESSRGTWNFSTPRGAFHVVYKEREPDWIAPDWHFVENGLRVPPPGHPSRRHVRGLGAAAVFIGRGLAIHGTDKPHLLGQRVSHGCIRLSDADALRLYHNVQVGTEVVIMRGGSRGDARAPRAAPGPARAAGTPPPRDPVIVALEAEHTPALLGMLEERLAEDPRGAERPRWTDVASVLLLRGVREEDDEALGGVFATAAFAEEGRARDELLTFATDAFVQGPLRALGVLGRMRPELRGRVARLITEASVALFPGETGDPQLPWPTRRVPRDALSASGRRAWDALVAAEAELRPVAAVAAGDR